MTVVGPAVNAKGQHVVIVTHTLTTGAKMVTHHRFDDPDKAANFAAEKRGEVAPPTREPALPPKLRVVRDGDDR